MWVSVFLFAPLCSTTSQELQKEKGKGGNAVSDGLPASTPRDATGSNLPARFCPASHALLSPSSTYLIVSWHRRGL